MSNSIFHLPDLGEGLPDAEISQWHVKEGDVVKADDLMVSMETAKAVVDVPAPQSGKIVKLYGKPGDIIKTGAPLVEFAVASTVESSTEKPKSPDKTAKKAETTDSADKGTVVGSMQISDHVLLESATGIEVKKSQSQTTKALPAVRMLAKQLNVELSTVTPTGKNGEIIADDIKRAAMVGQVISSSQGSQLSPQGLSDSIEPLRGVRRAMANAMSQSHAEVVPVTIVDDADISAWPKGTDITARVVRAICYACRVEPALNAHFNKDKLEIQRFGEVHLGMAMDSKDGLFVPVIRKADQLSASQIRQTIDRFKKQVADRSVPQDELKGSTIQLSNFGTFAGRYANPIIVPPIVAILGTGRIRDEVVAIQGAIAVHRVIPLSLSIDHRGVTGGEAARFLAAVIRDLQEPQ